MFQSYRNQSVDLQRKSTDWDLYDRNIGRYKVKTSVDLALMLKTLVIRDYSVITFALRRGSGGPSFANMNKREGGSKKDNFIRT